MSSLPAPAPREALALNRPPSRPRPAWVEGHLRTEAIRVLSAEYKALLDKTQTRPPNLSQRQRLAQLDAALSELQSMESPPVA